VPAPGALQSPQPSSQSLGWPWPHVSLSHGHTHGVLERTSVRLAGKARRFIHGVTALGQPVGMVYSLVVLLKKGLRHCPARLLPLQIGARGSVGVGTCQTLAVAAGSVLCARVLLFCTRACHPGRGGRCPWVCKPRPSRGKFNDGVSRAWARLILRVSGLSHTSCNKPANEFSMPALAVAAGQHIMFRASVVSIVSANNMRIYVHTHIYIYIYIYIT